MKSAAKGKRRLQVQSHEDAVVTVKQHTAPCDDCPWARESTPGWLGSRSIVGWLSYVLADGLITCHTRKSAADLHFECAGAAIFRSNMSKLPKPGPGQRLPLALGRDTKTVFANHVEFTAHHESAAKVDAAQPRFPVALKLTTNLVDSLITPANMTKAEAKEFLEELIYELTVRVEAL